MQGGDAPTQRVKLQPVAVAPSDDAPIRARADPRSWARQRRGRLPPRASAPTRPRAHDQQRRGRPSIVEPFLGEIRIVSFSFAPRGWAFCAGQLLPINQNQALFALLGINYGWG